MLQEHLDALEEQVRRIEQERLSGDHVSGARLGIIINSNRLVSLFSEPVMRLKMEPNWSIDTAATDGKHMFYNPDYVLSLTRKELMGVIVHEAMHCMLRHFARLHGRRPRLANIAMDLAINPLIAETFTLPKDGLMPGKAPFDDIPANELIWEQIYDLLAQKHSDGADGDESYPAGIGEVQEAQGHEQQAEAEWEAIAGETAKKAKGIGNLSGGMKSFFDAVDNPKIPWQQVLQQFVDHSVYGEDDYSWQRPDRRFIDHDLLIPGLFSERIGELVVVIDTSGSVQDILPLFGAELMGMLSTAPVKVHIVYCDCQINHTETWQPSDGPLVLHNIGGGGTSHEPVWEWINNSDVDPLAIIALTDGHTTWGDGPASECPVLWAITKDGNHKAPFGTVLVIE